jgi:hypothetical protein
MKNTKHTPGPWTADKYDSEELFIWAKDATICEINDPNSGQEREANAQLIAAAPDLAEAAKDAVDWMAEMGGGHDVYEKLIEALQKAGIEL